MAKQINPQGYNYGKDPTNSNPFWSESEIAEKLTASASVDNTTGTPEVSVSTTGYNVDFKFSGLKGERGEKGEQGAPGEKGEQGERGASGKDGKNGYNVTLDSTGSKESGTISTILYGYTMENGEYKPVTSYVYNGKKGERGEKGEQGERGLQGVAGKDGKDGKDADISSCVTNVSVTGDNGKYTIKQTKGTGTGTVESEVGEITVPDTSNLLAEITDSVTENTTDGYNHHVIKETKNNGTQNDVGNFYIARKQITGVKSTTFPGYWTNLNCFNFALDTVNQDGNTEELDGGIQIVRLADLSVTFPSGSISVESGKTYIIICNPTLKYKYTDTDGTIYDSILGYGDSMVLYGTPIIFSYNGSWITNMKSLTPYDLSGMFLTSTVNINYPYGNNGLFAEFYVTGNKNQEITVMNSNNQSKKITLKDLKFSLDENVSANNVMQYNL